MGGQFAENTSVSVIQTRAEIEKTLMRYGVFERQFTDTTGKSVIQFKSSNRLVRFTLTLPDQNEPRFKVDGNKRTRSPEKKIAAWEQACRQKWRALYLGIKAKLEIVSSGIATFEEEFLAHVVMPNGQTVGELTTPAIEKSYAANLNLLSFDGGGKQ